MEEQTWIWLNKTLADQIKTKYPELQTLSYRAIADWALRKILELPK